MTEKGYLHRRSDNFAKLPEALIHDLRITDGAHRLYSHMHWRYGSNMDNHEGRASMADMLGVSETTITNRAQELEQQDWIIIRARITRNGRKTNFYHVFETQDDCRAFRLAHGWEKPAATEARRKSRKGVGGRPSHKNGQEPKETQVEIGSQKELELTSAMNSGSRPLDPDSLDPDSDPNPDGLGASHEPAAAGDNTLDVWDVPLNKESPYLIPPKGMSLLYEFLYHGASRVHYTLNGKKTLCERSSSTIFTSETDDTTLLPCRVCTHKAEPAPSSPVPSAPSSIKVIHVRDITGRPNINPDYVYIGRTSGTWPESKWANPYKIDRDGTREEVINRYRDYLLQQPALLAALPELRGKTLICWCKPEDCHGDILAALAGQTNEEIARLVKQAKAPQPHVAIIQAYHYAIPEAYRPKGKPGIARSAGPAMDLKLGGITPEQVATFVRETYASYLTWAEEAPNRPMLMSLEHVRSHIGGWIASREKKTDQKEKQNNGTDSTDANRIPAQPPRPRVFATPLSVVRGDEPGPHLPGEGQR